MKKELLSYLYCLFIIVLFRQMINAQWTELNGPTDFVSSLVVIDGTLFAATGTDDGIYRLENDGENWELLSIDPNDYHTRIQSVVTTGDNLYLSTLRGIFLSTDRGTNWVSVTSDLPLTRSLASSGTSIFAGTNKGIFRSIDNGINWIKANTGLPDTNIFSISVTENALFTATVRGGLFRSTNNGNEWTSVCSGLLNARVNCVDEYGSTLFAGTNKGLFRSLNNAENWTTVDLGIGVSVKVYSLYKYGNMILAGTDAGIYCSTNNGDTWTAANPGNPLKRVQSFISMDNTLYAGNIDDGVMRSKDKGTTWVKATSGISHMWVPSLYSSGKKIFAGMTLAVYISTDNGAHWTKVNKGLSGLVTCFGENNGSVVALTEHGGVHSFNERSMSWTTVIDGPGINRAVSLAIIDSDIFVATDSCGMFRTTFGGTEWIAVNSGLPANCKLRALTAHGNILFVSTFRNGTFSSADKGSNWTAVASGLTNQSVLSLASKGSSVFAGTFNGIFRSDNNGKDWEAVNLHIKNKGIYHIIPFGNTIFAGGHYFLCQSSDNYEQWTIIDSGFSNNVIYSIAATDEYIFAGMTSSLLRRPNTERIALPVVYQPHKHKMMFQPSFTLRYASRKSSTIEITFSLPSIEHVSVKIFNLLGKETTSLLNAPRNQGLHTLFWDTRFVPRGYYTVQLNSSTDRWVKRISVFR